MPFRSQAQRRWMFAAEKRGEVPKGTAERWARHTPNIKSLPKRVKKKITMTKGEAVKEHTHLVKVLKSGKGLKSEAKKQERELKEYKKAKRKPKFVVNNKIRAYGEEDDRTGRIQINVKKHKGDKKELMDTVAHELMHFHHPKMHEKTVYKRTKGENRSASIKKFLKLLK